MLVQVHVLPGYLQLQAAINNYSSFVLLPNKSYLLAELIEKYVFFIFGSLKKGNRPFSFIFLTAKHHGHAYTKQ